MLKVVIDTNVLISGMFWAGPPNKILRAWQAGKIRPVINQEILDEYLRVANSLSNKYPIIALEPFFDLFLAYTDFHQSTLPIDICRDPTDNKFISCALAGDARYIISGDKDLLVISKYINIEIIKPKEFIKNIL